MLSRLIDIQRDKEAAPFWDKFTTTTIPPFPQLVALTPRLNAAGALQAANTKTVFLSSNLDGAPKGPRANI